MESLWYIFDHVPNRMSSRHTKQSKTGPSAIPVFIDNRAALIVTNHPVTTQESRHIQLREYRVRDFQETGVARVFWCPSEFNASDTMTKLLKRNLFLIAKQLLGVGNQQLPNDIKTIEINFLPYDTVQDVMFLDADDQCYFADISQAIFDLIEYD